MKGSLTLAEPTERQPDATPDAPRDRGRLLSTKDVSEEIYRGAKSVWWVTHHFAPDYKITQGRHAFWWEGDAYAWLDAQRKRAS